MSQSRRRRGQLISALLDLLACLAGFSVAALIEYNWMELTVLVRPEPWFSPWIISALIAWLAMVFPESQWHEGFRLWVDGFFSIVGSNLLVQYGLSYLQGITPAYWPLLILGSALSIAVSSLLRKLAVGNSPAARKNGVLLVGFDETTARLSGALQGQVVGGLETSADMLPAGIPFLGSMDSLAHVCEQRHPGTIIVSNKQSVVVPPAELLRLHYSGVQVESAPLFYERVLRRVAWQCLPASELLFFLNPDSSRATLAFQAIYTNLIGLGLRLLSAPLLILLSVLVVISSGSPALEHIECLGYQRTPFRLLRFRIYRKDGTLSGIGRIIAKMRLTNLPYLINVVRGEMTLFGPAPARTPLANRLTQLIPAYVYRFSVKPGILGWHQAMAAVEGDVPDEINRLECDLYYIRQESPSLDLNILMRTLFRRSSPKRQPEAVPSLVSHS
jgi:lipopolysaccharide/colanic/teichoic acid biosynthesis glycosyltransferase